MRIDDRVRASSGHWLEIAPPRQCLLRQDVPLRSAQVGQDSLTPYLDRGQPALYVAPHRSIPLFGRVNLSLRNPPDWRAEYYYGPRCAVRYERVVRVAEDASPDLHRRRGKFLAWLTWGSRHEIDDSRSPTGPGRQRRPKGFPSWVEARSRRAGKGTGGRIRRAFFMDFP